jgi:hypothetical protein
MPVMALKTHAPLVLDEKEMLERIRQAQVEDRDGALTHITNKEELRTFFASLRSSEA